MNNLYSILGPREGENSFVVQKTKQQSNNKTTYTREENLINKNKEVLLDQNEGEEK